MYFTIMHTIYKTNFYDLYDFYMVFIVILRRFNLHIKKTRITI